LVISRIDFLRDVHTQNKLPTNHVNIFTTFHFAPKDTVLSWIKNLFGKPELPRVSISDGGPEFCVKANETILERALLEGLAYPHDCTVGTCGTCRTKLLSGKVDAITPFSYTLSREELEAGYILACQAIPKVDVEIAVELGSAEGDAIVTQARISSMDPLTHDILRVVWNCDRPMQYKAGQYVNVRWNGGDMHRSYSFATAPEADGSTCIQSFIRHVPGGAFTDALFGGQAKEYMFELDGPHGQFWLRPGDGPILCIAGGSGLAPIISLLQDAARKRVRRDCVLLFGGRAKRDLYADAEIGAIRTGWTAGFTHWPVLSDAPEEGLRAGLVTEHIATALEKLGTGVQAYLCGPPPMIDAGIAELLKLGVPIDAIFYDKFTDASTAQ
jgi:p-cymene methyl-monooxygenase electron transfer component